MTWTIIDDKNVQHKSTDCPWLVPTEHYREWIACADWRNETDECKREDCPHRVLSWTLLDIKAWYCGHQAACGAPCASWVCPLPPKDHSSKPEIPYDGDKYCFRRLRDKARNSPKPDEMEMALKVISTWADVWLEGEMSDDCRKNCMRQIRDKAMEALGRE